ncbi:MAG: hypothetical protein ABR607_05190 [Pyrinomonadaceae bacterium]
MKKIFAFMLTVTIFAGLSMTTFAQGRHRRSRDYECRNYESRNYDSRNYNSQGYYDNSQVNYDYGTTNRGQRTWDRHRDKLTVAAGTVGGAILGSLLGGRRGAAIGALAGAGGSALYTYKLRRNRYRY